MTGNRRSIPNDRKHTIADDATYPKGFHRPRPRGWYHSVVNVCDTPEGLVCVYRLSDSHTAVYTHIMVAYSNDGGTTWTGHHSIAHSNVWEQQAVWVAPQLSRLRDGRLVIICDRGHRTSHDDWPMITVWQRPPRGMANYLFWSEDNGKTWSEGVKIDDVGGEPSYITELSDGTLVFTRTEPNRYEGMYDPPQPWGTQCYLSVAVFSDDGGKTWNRTSIVTNEPYESDNEVAVCELAPGHLIAFTRIGFGGGRFGQPSRLAHSYDGGRTWGKPVLTPYYGQRPMLGKLASGKLLVTYRNRWGTPGSCAAVFDASEDHGFEPSSWIIEESRCRIADDEMTLTTGDGATGRVEFGLYPAIDDAATVQIDAVVKVSSTSADGAAYISAGFRMNLSPTGIALVDRDGRPVAEAHVDVTDRHHYRLVRSGRSLSVSVDGEEMFSRSIDGVETRIVRFGGDGNGESMWSSVVATVQNPSDYSIQWDWDASRGFPDQFQREHTVRLDLGGHGSDSGYSGWTQMADGTIVIVDYTNNHHLNSTWQGGPLPFARAYVVAEETLT